MSKFDVNTCCEGALGGDGRSWGLCGFGRDPDMVWFFTGCEAIRHVFQG